MRLGFLPNGKQKLSPKETLDFAREHGFEGVQFSTPGRLSASFDVGELRDLRGYAESLGLYADASVSHLNPNTVRGDVKEHYATVRRELDVLHAAGFRRIRAALGTLPDRFKATPAWQQQLRDSAEAIKREVAPLLRDLGIVLAVENHGDASVRELIRLVEEVGPDALGICLDTANIFLNLEDPLTVAAEAAPYVRMTHAKDGILFLTEGGLARQVRPAGKGSIDWPALLGVLVAHNPNLDLTIEDHRDNPGGADPFRVIRVFDDAFLEYFPELDARQLVRLFSEGYRGSQRLAAGEIPTLAAYAGEWQDDGLQRLLDARQYLRGVIDNLAAAAKAE